MRYGKQAGLTEEDLELRAAGFAMILGFGALALFVGAVVMAVVLI